MCCPVSIDALDDVPLKGIFYALIIVPVSGGYLSSAMLTQEAVLY